MLQFLQGVGRKAVIVNLDFANEKPPYSSTIDVRDLIALEVSKPILSLVVIVC